MIALTIIILIVWTMIALVYFATQIGDKHSNEKYPIWEWVLCTPALVVAYSIGYLTNRK